MKVTLKDIGLLYYYIYIFFEMIMKLIVYRKDHFWGFIFFARKDITFHNMIGPSHNRTKEPEHSNKFLEVTSNEINGA